MSQDISAKCSVSTATFGITVTKYLNLLNFKPKKAPKPKVKRPRVVMCYILYVTCNVLSVITWLVLLLSDL